jgi:hypothetical protein
LSASLCAFRAPLGGTQVHLIFPAVPPIAAASFFLSGVTMPGLVPQVVTEGGNEGSHGRSQVVANTRVESARRQAARDS